MSIVVARIYLGWEHAGTQGWRGDIDIDIYLLHGGTWHRMAQPQQLYLLQMYCIRLQKSRAMCVGYISVDYHDMTEVLRWVEH